MAPPRLPNILFQDDEPVICFHGEMALEEGGMEVTGVLDNESARRAIREADPPFDVIVLNGRLPDGRGTALCAELRFAGITTPVLMQSANCYIEDYREAMRAGVNDYLDKPWTDADLVERVQLLLDMPPLRWTATQTSPEGSGSNIATVKSFCDERIRSAMAHVAAVRPAPGSLPKHVPGTGEDEGKDVRAIALSEEQAEDLVATLKAIERHLAENAQDKEEQVELRAKVLVFIRAIASWIGQRAGVATDETIKMFVRVALPAYLAHLAGLKLDLVQILAALGLKVGN